MLSDAPPKTRSSGEVDHERLRDATRILGGQQGLYTVCFGAVLLLPELDHVWNGLTGWWAVLVGLGVLAIYLAALKRWIPSYYQKRFGHVEAQGPSVKQFAVFLFVIVALFFFGEPLAHHADPMIAGFVDRRHTMISDSNHQINLWPLLFWILVCFSSVRVHPRRMRTPGLYFHLSGLLGATSVALYPMWHPGATRIWLWRVLNAGGIGLSFIAMGSYDHFTLVRVLPNRGSGDDNE